MKNWSKFAHSHFSKLQPYSSLIKPASYPFVLKLCSIICLLPWISHRPKSHKILSIPKTVYMMTFWLNLASFLSIFVEAVTYFRQRKNVVSFLYSSLFSTDVFLAFMSARMKNATQPWLLECVCNTFGMYLTFQLFWNFHIIYVS